MKNNLHQLIKEPTHFTEYSSSLIDSILVSNLQSNDIFVEQTMIDDNNASLPAPMFPEDLSHNTVSVTPEVKPVLKTLKLGKTSGPDSNSAFESIN